MRLFTKTCRKDEEFLFCAAASVRLRCTDPIDWVVVCDDGDAKHTEEVMGRAFRHATGQMNGERTVVSLRVVEVSSMWKDAMQLRDGYLIQQWVKMNAHRVTGGGYFMNWDSDVVAVKSFSEKDFLCNGKPVLFFTPFNSIFKSCGERERGVHVARQSFIRNACEVSEAPFEYMRTMPLWMNGDILRIGESRKEWIRVMILMTTRVDGMSEFNVIGFFSHFFFPDAYYWKNTDQEKTWSGALMDKDVIAHQSWSWGGMSEDMKRKAIYV